LYSAARFAALRRTKNVAPFVVVERNIRSRAVKFIQPFENTYFSMGRGMRLPDIYIWVRRSIYA
jgi:hypothetical protein